MTKLSKIYTLKDMLAAYKGVCGRSYMLQQLREIPEIDGEPTHRYLGNKIVFFEEDLPRLRECLTMRPPPTKGTAVTAAPSAEERAEQALRLAEKMAAPGKTKRRAPRR
jgi:hypothetical protein